MKRYFTRLSNQTPQIRMDDFLSGWLPVVLDSPISKSKIRTLILSGAVYVNRHRNKIPSSVLYAGAVIEVYYSDAKMQNARASEKPLVRNLTEESIVFEDEWLIAINKPSHLPTQPTVDPHRPNLFDLLRSFLEKRLKKPAYLGLHHRLDRDTSGVVLFTKKEEANKGVADLFAKHEIRKTYQCLVWNSAGLQLGPDSESFQVKNYLGRISPKNENAKYGEVASNGDLAITRFRVIEKFKGVFWLEASPETGRTHQIRVHCSERGLPILGDTIYFPADVTPIVRAPRLMLHASRLEFIHPITHLPITIHAQIPSDFLTLLGELKA